MENEIMVRENCQVVNFEDMAMSKDGIIRQLSIVKDVMQAVMKEGEHYGKIPGCGNKPSLLKPGAEKLGTTFRLRPEYRITRSDMPGGHREYEIICTLYHIPTGQSVGEGVGACSTMEGKFRFRGGEKEGTGQPIPKEYWNLRKEGKSAEAQASIGGPGYGTGKIEGVWEICSIGEKVEHDNPADYYNTVLKMGKKRAQVDAILTATAASDIFTQDIEDMPEVIDGTVKTEKRPPVTQPQERSAPQEGGNKPKGTPISEAQRKRLYAIYKGAGKTDEQLKVYLKAKHGIETSKDIPKEHYEAICAWAESKEEEKTVYISCPEHKKDVGIFECEICNFDPPSCDNYQAYLDSKRA